MKRLLLLAALALALAAFGGNIVWGDSPAKAGVPTSQVGDGGGGPPACAPVRYGANWYGWYNNPYGPYYGTQKRWWVCYGGKWLPDASRPPGNWTGPGSW